LCTKGRMQSVQVIIRMQLLSIPPSSVSICDMTPLGTTSASCGWEGCARHPVSCAQLTAPAASTSALLSFVVSSNIWLHQWVLIHRSAAIASEQCFCGTQHSTAQHSKAVR
jgi:hypothetical protein